MSTISASAARQTLPSLLDRVEAGEEVAITRHGRAIAVLVRPDALITRRASDVLAYADRLSALLEHARTEPLRHPPITRERAEELVESVRADRSAR